MSTTCSADGRPAGSSQPSWRSSLAWPGGCSRRETPDDGAAVPPSGSDADEATRGLEMRRPHPGLASRRRPLDVDVVERMVLRLSEPVRDPVRIAGDLELHQVDTLAIAGDRRVLTGVGLPADEERQLGVGHQPHDADLPPEQLETVRTLAVALYRRPAQPGLDSGQVVDGDDPAEPPASSLATRPDGLAERNLVRHRVVQHVDDFEVMPARQRQHAVPGPEAWVDPPVDQLYAECVGQPAARHFEPFRACGVGDVVQTHARILTAP